MCIEWHSYAVAKARSAASAPAPTTTPTGPAVVVGAGIGLAVDYALAKGLELAGRGDFEKDVAFALRTAQGEWRCALESELRRAVGLLVDDAVQLTAAAYQKGGAPKAVAAAAKESVPSESEAG